MSGVGRRSTRDKFSATPTPNPPQDQMRTTHLQREQPMLPPWNRYTHWHTPYLSKTKGESKQEVQLWKGSGGELIHLHECKLTHDKGVANYTHTGQRHQHRCWAEVTVPAICTCKLSVTKGPVKPNDFHIWHKTGSGKGVKSPYLDCPLPRWFQPQFQLATLSQEETTRKGGEEKVN